MKTHWKKLDNPNYLGAYSLLGVTDSMQLTINKVVVEEVKNSQGSDTCKIAYFKEDVKPMILNTVNCKAIEDTYDTPFIEDWSDKKITVYVKKIKAFGEKMDALRVRPPVTKKSINNERFSKSLQAIKNGQYTKEKLIEQFELTKPQHEKLATI